MPYVAYFPAVEALLMHIRICSLSYSDMRIYSSCTSVCVSFIATHRSLVGVHAQTTNVRSHQKSFAFEEDYRRLKKQRSGIVVRGGFLKKNNNNNALLAY